MKVCADCGEVIEKHPISCCGRVRCYQCYNRHVWAGQCFNEIEHDELASILHVSWDPSTGSHEFILARCLECGESIGEDQYLNMRVLRFPISRTPYFYASLHNACVEPFFEQKQYLRESAQRDREIVAEVEAELATQNLNLHASATIEAGSQEQSS